MSVCLCVLQSLLAMCVRASLFKLLMRVHKCFTSHTHALKSRPALRAHLCACTAAYLGVSPVGPLRLPLAPVRQADPLSPHSLVRTHVSPLASRTQTASCCQMGIKKRTDVSSDTLILVSVSHIRMCLVPPCPHAPLCLRPVVSQHAQRTSGAFLDLADLEMDKCGAASPHARCCRF